MENYAFKGVWVSKEIWINEKLTWMEKLFITEINALDNDDGCFASNDFFSKFFQITKQRCSQIIKSIESKGFISIEYDRNGKEIKKRVLRIIDRGIKNSFQGYQENAKDNNIKDNNINRRSNKIKKDTNSPSTTILFNSIHEYFKQINSLLYFDKTQAGATKTIINRFNGDSEKIFNYIKKYKSEISRNKDKFWKSSPLTPRGFLSRIDTIIALDQNVDSEYRDM
jgi:hypothetical protein